MRGGRRTGKNFVWERVYFERFEVGEVSRSPVKGLSWLIVCLLVTAGIIGLWYFIPEGTGLNSVSVAWSDGLTMPTTLEVQLEKQVE